MSGLMFVFLKLTEVFTSFHYLQKSVVHVSLDIKTTGLEGHIVVSNNMSDYTAWLHARVYSRCL